jgi:20S proteasome alpha/beta subunit
MIVRYLLLIVLLACNELCCVSNSYDTSITLFSNSGELLQVVYARLAGLKGESAICGIDEEKREILLCYKVAAQSQKLLDRSHIEKLSRIDDHLYMTFAGLAGDGRAIVKRAREFCIEMYCKLGMRPSVACVAAEVAKWQHEATLYGGKDVKTTNINIHEGFPFREKTLWYTGSYIWKRS